MAKLVEKTYGDALFELALESDSVDNLYEEAQGVLHVIGDNPDMIKFLNHPKITSEEKVAFIEKIFKNRVSEQMVGLLVMLVKKERQNQIDKVIAYFIDEIKEYKKIGVVYVTTSLEMKESQKEKLIQKLLSTTGYKSLEMHYAVDKSIIGGIIIRIGDRVVDSSIRTKTYDLSRDLYKIQLT